MVDFFHQGLPTPTQPKVIFSSPSRRLDLRSPEQPYPPLILYRIGVLLSSCAPLFKMKEFLSSPKLLTSTILGLLLRDLQFLETSASGFPVFCQSPFETPGFGRLDLTILIRRTRDRLVLYL